MQAIVFMGIQASGKSSFYKERFFHTHVRINLDMLRTRRREALLVSACLEGKTPFVMDNTNVVRAERATLIAQARQAGFSVVGYFFQSRVAESLERNARREGKQCVPRLAILGTSKRMELPSKAEGFEALFFVRLSEMEKFEVEEWKDV